MYARKNERKRMYLQSNDVADVKTQFQKHDFDLKSGIYSKTLLSHSYYTVEHNPKPLSFLASYQTLADRLFPSGMQLNDASFHKLNFF